MTRTCMPCSLRFLTVPEYALRFFTVLYEEGKFLYDFSTVLYSFLSRALRFFTVLHGSLRFFAVCYVSYGSLDKDDDTRRRTTAITARRGTDGGRGIRLCGRALRAVAGGQNLNATHGVTIFYNSLHENHSLEPRNFITSGRPLPPLTLWSRLAVARKFMA